MGIIFLVIVWVYVMLVAYILCAVGAIFTVIWGIVLAVRYFRKQNTPAWMWVTFIALCSVLAVAVPFVLQ